METSSVFSGSLSLASLDTILTIIWLLLVIFFMVHSAVVAYHWTTYGSHKSHAFTGTLAHIAVGAVILLAMGAIIFF